MVMELMEKLSIIASTVDFVSYMETLFVVAKII